MAKPLAAPAGSSLGIRPGWAAPQSSEARSGARAPLRSSRTAIVRKVAMESSVAARDANRTRAFPRPDGARALLGLAIRPAWGQLASADKDTQLLIVIPPKRTATVEAGAARPWCQRSAAIE
jgi:hypothetical protein